MPFVQTPWSEASKHHVNVRIDIDELDLTAAESKATYEEIKSYMAEHNAGMKVSNSDWSGVEVFSDDSKSIIG